MGLVGTHDFNVRGLTLDLSSQNDIPKHRPYGYYRLWIEAARVSSMGCAAALEWRLMGLPFFTQHSRFAYRHRNFIPISANDTEHGLATVNSL